MNSETKEILERLKHLDELLDEALREHDYYQHGWVAECSQEVEHIIKPFKKLPKKPSVFEHLPSFSPDNTKVIALEKNYLSKKRIIILLLLITVITGIAFFKTHLEYLNPICSTGVIATVIFYFVFSQSKSNYYTEKKKYDEKKTASTESLQRFHDAICRYEKEKVSALENLKVFVKEYQTAYGKYESVLETYSKKKEDAFASFVSNMEQAKEIDIVPQEYYHLLKAVISLLKSGRADTYKEALNMAIEEERLEEAEQYRREEELKRTRILEEQAQAEQRRLQEQERHNYQMEMEQQYQNKMMLEEVHNQQRDAQKTAQKAKSEAMYEESRARTQALHRCAKCRKRAACGARAGIPNCGAFDPR